jgi:hypothetical protein
VLSQQPNQDPATAANRRGSSTADLFTHLGQNSYNNSTLFMDLPQQTFLNSQVKLLHQKQPQRTIHRRLFQTSWSKIIKQKPTLIDFPQQVQSTVKFRILQQQ